MTTATDNAPIIDLTVIDGRGGAFYSLLAGLAMVIAGGMWAAHVMGTQGHYVTGMNNQIVWGIPHVFAVFLIVCASGALNVASLSSLMGQKIYAPYARLSGLLAIALLLGGLAIITLDLGRPERLMVALTHFNMASVFAWNVFFYTGFLLLAALYLWTLMDRSMHRFSKPVAGVLLAWRLTLTTFTGLIFGVLVARQAYDTVIMAPLFIAMSLLFGGAAYTLLLLAVCRWTGRPLGDAVLRALARMIGLCIIVVLCFVALFHGFKIFTVGFEGMQAFLLLDGGVFPLLFWVGQIAAGSLLPLGLLMWRPAAATRVRIAVAAGLVLLGGLTQLYVIVIGAQAFPLDIFPGKQVIESSFYDGVIAHYQPSMLEFLLAFGGVALALLIVLFAMKILPFLPRVRARD